MWHPRQLIVNHAVCHQGKSPSEMSQCTSLEGQGDKITMTTKDVITLDHKGCQSRGHGNL